MKETALLALDGEGRQIVSIHAKRTYRISSSARCILADVQRPFLIPDEDVPESDVMPMKTATDLIVIGTAYGRGGATELTAGIDIGSLARRYQIFGERRCIYRGCGEIAFSEPDRIERVRLRYENAYGGFDPTVPESEATELMDLLGSHPGLYPRNPVGKGYAVFENSHRIDGLALPQIENPEHLLTPDTLVVGSPANWWKQPLPWCCDWFAPTWYPRCAYLGGFPDHIPEDETLMPEIRLGWVDSAKSRRARVDATGDLSAMLDSRLVNAASPSLVLPFLRGDEAIRLHGMTPDGNLVVQLPGDRPKIQVRFEGRTYDVDAVPNRILISTEEMGVYIVWHGAWRTPRQLPDRLPVQGDTMKMELEGVESFVDGQRIEPLE